MLFANVIMNCGYTCRSKTTVIRLDILRLKASAVVVVRFLLIIVRADVVLIVAVLLTETLVDLAVALTDLIGSLNG